MKQTVKNRNLFRIGAVLLLAALWVVTPFLMGDGVVQADGRGIRHQASLSGAPINGITPTGYAEYREQTKGSLGVRRRLSVQAYSVSLPENTLLDIFISNTFIGQMRIDNSFNGYFNLDGGRGQSVPIITSGEPLEIRQGSTVIVAGIFGTVTATPSPSGTPTGSPSPSPSGSPEPTPSVSPTVLPSPTASPTPNASPSPSPGEFTLFATLSGGAINGVNPTGTAQYEVHSSRRELEVFVSQVNLPSGTSLAVVVDNATVGQIFLNGNSGSIRLRTDNGDFIPNVVPGSTIQIRNGGATILSGVFNGVVGPSPSPTASPNPTPAPPAERYFEAHLRGADTEANNVTASQGTVKVFLNEAENTVRVVTEFTNQSGARADAKVFANSTVLFDLGSIEAAQAASAEKTFDVTAEQARALRAGLAIVGIESEDDTNGQVSGRLIMRSDANDFDGGTDFALSPYAVGKWLVQGGVSLYNEIIGSDDAQTVSFDFDGDGKADTAVFRPSNGTWSWSASSDGAVNIERFGADGDLSVIGDFDGDGKTDVAISRPSTGEWFVLGSSQNVKD